MTKQNFIFTSGNAEPLSITASSRRFFIGHAITRVQIYLFNKLPEQLKNKITVNNQGCWIWQGEINRNGYGRCRFQGARFMVHRLVWKILKDDIGSERVLDHLCKTRNCCNPTHLSPVTHRHNTHRGKAKLFTKKSG